MVIARHINLYRTFKIGQIIKVKESADLRSRDARELSDDEISIIVPGKYKIVGIYRFFLLCKDSIGRKVCFNWGDLAMNGLIGVETPSES